MFRGSVIGGFDNVFASLALNSEGSYQSGCSRYRSVKIDRLTTEGPSSEVIQVRTVWSLYRPSFLNIPFVLSSSPILIPMGSPLTPNALGISLVTHCSVRTVFRTVFLGCHGVFHTMFP